MDLWALALAPDLTSYNYPTHFDVTFRPLRVICGGERTGTSSHDSVRDFLFLHCSRALGSDAQWERNEHPFFMVVLRSCTHVLMRSFWALVCLRALFALFALMRVTLRSFSSER